MKVALDTTLRETLSKTCFRDVILSKESRGRGGLRQFLGMPGQTREQAARDIVRLYAVNRFPFLSTELRTFREAHFHEKQEGADQLILNMQATPLRRFSPLVKHSPELMLFAPVHSIFCRPRTPVNFILDIDCRHEGPQESADPSRFEDQLLGFCFSACRAAFHKHGLSPSKVAVLTASGLDINGQMKPYASFHLHMDLEGAAFGDSFSVGSFVQRELLPEITKLGGGGQASAKLAARLREAIDLAPFLTSVGGSLRVYGAPKLDGTRPLRLFRPGVGGACATALYAMGAARGAAGGPTMRLLAEAEKKAMDKKDSTTTTTSDPIEEAVMDPVTLDNELTPSRVMKGLRPVELEALALSLGTPDWMGPDPLRFLYFGGSNAAGGGGGKFAFASSSENNNSPATTDAERQQQQQLPFDMLPQRVIKELNPADHKVPFPMASASPETYALCAALIAPQIHPAHAKPYRSWVSVALSLTEISAFNAGDVELQQKLQDSFIRFAERAPNYSHEACVRLWSRMMWRKTGRKAKPLTAADARESYLALVNWLKRPPPSQ